MILMKKLVLSLILVAFAVPALRADDAKAAKDAKDCKDTKVSASSCAGKDTCCAKEAALKKGFNPSEKKGAMQLVKR
jgi:hypothetical protein